jgi:hypothetical protein
MPAGGTHVPAPSQKAVGVSVLPAQDGDAQARSLLGNVHAAVVVLGATSAHAAPQTPLPGHGWRLLPIGPPVVTGAHVPGLARLQAWHCPSQRALQHTPSTQNFDAHAWSEVHAAPREPLPPVP